MPAVHHLDGRFSTWNGGVKRDFPGGGTPVRWDGKVVQRAVSFGDDVDAFKAELLWEQWLNSNGYRDFDMRQLMCWEAYEAYKAWLVEIGTSKREKYSALLLLKKRIWIPLVKQGIVPPFDTYANRKGRVITGLRDSVLALGAEVERLVVSVSETEKIRKRLTRSERANKGLAKRVRQLTKRLEQIEELLASSIILRKKE